VEISTRDLVTVLHGMGFGALFMLAFSGAIAELYRMSAVAVPVQPTDREQTLLAVYLIGMAVLAWLAVFSGAYIVYPWYRAVPPAGSRRSLRTQERGGPRWCCSTTRRVN
jgi:hypothetical protein